MGKNVNENTKNGICIETELSANVMRYINENYKNKLRLADIANTFFVSVSTVCHYFKSDYGISIKQYIVKKRVTEAKKLIDEGMPAQAVCEKLGYERYTTFYRNYKDFFGVSPGGRNSKG